MNQAGRVEMLRCHNLSFSYGEGAVLRDFNCSIEKGELISIIGSSGSGKTSFLRLCAGLERPKSGQIFLREKQVAGPSLFVPPAKRNIGYVFQNLALFEKVKVRSNILYGCKNEADYREADRLVELMNLNSHLDKYPYQLSGGERQKVALARSLALKPDIMLLDEPFSSLDGIQTEFLTKELTELFETLSVTSIMVTHSRKKEEQIMTRQIDF